MLALLFFFFTATQAQYPCPISPITSLEEVGSEWMRRICVRTGSISSYMYMKAYVPYQMRNEFIELPLNQNMESQLPTCPAPYLNTNPDNCPLFAGAGSKGEKSKCRPQFNLALLAGSTTTCNFGTNGVRFRVHVTFLENKQELFYTPTGHLNQLDYFYSSISYCFKCTHAVHQAVGSITMDRTIRTAWVKNNAKVGTEICGTGAEIQQLVLANEHQCVLYLGDDVMIKSPMKPEQEYFSTDQEVITPPPQEYYPCPISPITPLEQVGDEVMRRICTRADAGSVMNLVAFVPHAKRREYIELPLNQNIESELPSCPVPYLNTNPDNCPLFAGDGSKGEKEKCRPQFNLALAENLTTTCHFGTNGVSFRINVIILENRQEFVNANGGQVDRLGFLYSNSEYCFKCRDYRRVAVGKIASATKKIRTSWLKGNSEVGDQICGTGAELQRMIAAKEHYCALYLDEDLMIKSPMKTAKQYIPILDEIVFTGPPKVNDHVALNCVFPEAPGLVYEIVSTLTNGSRKVEASCTSGVDCMQQSLKFEFTATQAHYAKFVCQAQNSKPEFDLSPKSYALNSDAGFPLTFGYGDANVPYTCDCTCRNK